MSQNQNGGKGRKARSEIDLKKLDCASCVPRIEKGLKEIEGVESAKVNYLLNRLYVTFDLELTNESIIEATVEKLGYKLRHKRYVSLASRLLSLFSSHAHQK